MSERKAISLHHTVRTEVTNTYEIDPDHYEEAMGEPLRGSHPDTIEKYMYKNNIHSRIVDEEADTANAWCVEVDRLEEWSC